ncbi:MAG TPA: tetratricopeptide repeat protein [Terracidiphilus sp.]
MDTQTRHALKGDKFAQTAASGVEWLTGHRSNLTRWIVSAAVVLVVGVAVLVFWNVQSSAADSALGIALDAYNAPLAQAGVPLQPGEYATSADRAKAANQQFLDVAKKYGYLQQGAKAHYFAGVTYLDQNQNGPAETELKTAAGSWNRNLANLAKLALAGLYRKTSRDSDAIAIYNQLATKPSDTVSTSVAQLNLADLYAASGKQQEARALWAKVKDADKDGAAGAIAAQKLGAGQ